MLAFYIAFHQAQHFFPTSAVPERRRILYDHAVTAISGSVPEFVVRF
jgi:hypothetical protein